MNEQITALILAALSDLSNELDLPDLRNATPETRLFGANSLLDSMALVALIADVEDRVSDTFDQDIVLADEHAVSQWRSPFRSVASLAEFVAQRLSEDSGE